MLTHDDDSVCRIEVVKIYREKNNQIDHYDTIRVDEIPYLCDSMNLLDYFELQEKKELQSRLHGKPGNTMIQATIKWPESKWPRKVFMTMIYARHPLKNIPLFSVMDLRNFIRLCEATSDKDRQKFCSYQIVNILHLLVVQVPQEETVLTHWLNFQSRFHTYLPDERLQSSSLITAQNDIVVTPPFQTTRNSPPPEQKQQQQQQQQQQHHSFQKEEQPFLSDAASLTNASSNATATTTATATLTEPSSRTSSSPSRDNKNKQNNTTTMNHTSGDNSNSRNFFHPPNSPASSDSGKTEKTNDSAATTEKDTRRKNHHHSDHSHHFIRDDDNKIVRLPVYVEYDTEEDR